MFTCLPSVFHVFLGHGWQWFHRVQWVYSTFVALGAWQQNRSKCLRVKIYRWMSQIRTTHQKYIEFTWKMHRNTHWRIRFLLFAYLESPTLFTADLWGFIKYNLMRTMQQQEEFSGWHSMWPGKWWKWMEMGWVELPSTFHPWPRKAMPMCRHMIMYRFLYHFTRHNSKSWHQIPFKDHFKGDTDKAILVWARCRRPYKMASYGCVIQQIGMCWVLRPYCALYADVSWPCVGPCTVQATHGGLHAVYRSWTSIRSFVCSWIHFNGFLRIEMVMWCSQNMSKNLWSFRKRRNSKDSRASDRTEKKYWDQLHCPLRTNGLLTFFADHWATLISLTLNFVVFVTDRIRSDSRIAKKPTAWMEVENPVVLGKGWYALYLSRTYRSNMF